MAAFSELNFTQYFVPFWPAKIHTVVLLYGERFMQKMKKKFERGRIF